MRIAVGLSCSCEDACFGPHEAEDIASVRELCVQLGILYHVFYCSDGNAISFQPSMRPFAELKFTPIMRIGSPQDWNFS